MEVYTGQISSVCAPVFFLLKYLYGNCQVIQIQEGGAGKLFQKVLSVQIIDHFSGFHFRIQIVLFFYYCMSI